MKNESGNYLATLVLNKHRSGVTHSPSEYWDQGSEKEYIFDKERK
jgi:hypothetical protein